MRIYVAHSSESNFKEEIYEPIKKSKLFTDNDIFFPHDEKDKHIKTKDIIKCSDLIIAEVSFASIGLGIELGWADYSKVPILCVYKKEIKYSGSLEFITDNFIEYNNEVDMINKIEKFIENLEIKKLK